MVARLLTLLYVPLFVLLFALFIALCSTLRNIVFIVYHVFMSALPRLHHRLPEHPGHLLDALCHVNAKNYGAHNLESIIGHRAHLDHLLDVHWHLNAKSYGAHNLDSNIGHSEHLDH